MAAISRPSSSTGTRTGRQTGPVTPEGPRSRSYGRALGDGLGRLEDGRSFLVRDRRMVLRFYVETGDGERARELGAPKAGPHHQVTLLGRPVVRIEVKEPADTPPLRDRLAKADIPTYEADVRFAMRPLIDRGIYGSFEIHGEGRETPGFGLVFEDPEIFPADWTPRLRVLSLDIETDPAARRLLAIGLYGCGASEVLLLTPPGGGCPDGGAPFSCAAPSSGWTTTASTRWRARSWARARPSPGAAAPRRSCVSSRRTGSASSSTNAPTPASPSRCSSGSASSSSRSSAAASPASTRTSSCSTSRASTRASSAPSRSTL